MDLLDGVEAGVGCLMADPPRGPTDTRDGVAVVAGVEVACAGRGSGDCRRHWRLPFLLEVEDVFLLGIVPDQVAVG